MRIVAWLSALVLFWLTPITVGNLKDDSWVGQASQTLPSGTVTFGGFDRADLPFPYIYAGMQDAPACGIVGNPMPYYFVPLEKNTSGQFGQNSKRGNLTLGQNVMLGGTFGDTTAANDTTGANSPQAMDMDAYAEFAGSCFAKEGYRRTLADMLSLKFQYSRLDLDFGAFRFIDEQTKAGSEALSDTECDSFFSGLGQGDGPAQEGEIDVHYGNGNGFGKIDLFPAFGMRPHLPFTNGGIKNDDYATSDTLTLSPGGKLTLDRRLLGLERYNFSDDYYGSDGRIEGRLTTNAFGLGDSVASSFGQNLFNDYGYYNYSVPPGRLNARTQRYDESSGFDPFAGQRLLDDDGFGKDMKLTSNVLIGDTHFATGYARNDSPYLETYRNRIQPDYCRVVFVPTDPLYRKQGINDGNSWGERFDDQWAIKRVGFDELKGSAWDMADSANEVVVAVIDTGLDWDHADLDRANLWRNIDEVPENGIDDDQNGYVDDIIGWDFVNSSNRPWDYQGHGTIVAGIIAAAHNDQGIAGVNPRAKIMVVKAIDSGGRSRASLVARGIVYAVDNGAKVINLSVGGAELSDIERAAIEYAEQANVLMVVASGNEGKALDNYALADYEHVFTVGATYLDDVPAEFSNFGAQVDIAAPGVEILSLRARMTDTNYGADGDAYEMGEYVVHDKRYIKASGTSFAAPIVSGVASLVWGMNPQYSAADVKKVLTMSAEDVGLPGKDDRTGYGLVDARRAMVVDPNFDYEVEISAINVSQGQEGLSYELVGTARSQDFKRAWVSVGPGEEPRVWYRVGTKMKRPVSSDVLMTLPESTFPSTGIWQIALHVEDENGVIRAHRKPIRLR